MGDFDTVLERLLVDEPFRAALAANPDAALAGYRLTADEVDLLRSQVSSGTGADRGVETRNTKSSLFGLLGSLTGVMESATSGPSMVPPQPIGGGIGEFGAAGHGSLGLADGHGSLMAAGGQTTEATFGGPSQTLGVADGGGGSQTFGSAVGGAFGAAPGAHGALMPSGDLMQPGDHVPVGYHPHIDADGDGKWDQYTAVQHADGSVDIYVDRNHDGRIDFIGHDRNHDGRVESADYDENFNGTFETHMRDVNGDGWLDTRTVDPDK